MNAQKNFLVSTVILLAAFVHAQTKTQSVVFHKKKNPNKTYSIPLNQYPLFIKPKSGKKVFGIISACNDSELTFREKSTDKSVNEKILKISENPYLSESERKRKTDSLRYCDVKQIKLSDIDRIIIYNSLKPGKRWIAVTEYIVGISAFAFYYEYQNAKDPNSLSLPIPIIAIGYAAVVFYLQRRVINLDKWVISQT